MRSLPGPHGDFPGLYTARPLNRNLQAAQHRKIAAYGPKPLQSQEKPLHVQHVAAHYDQGKTSVEDVGTHDLVCSQPCLERYAERAGASTLLNLHVTSRPAHDDPHVPGSKLLPSHYTDQGFWEGEHKNVDGVLVEPQAPHLRRQVKGAHDPTGHEDTGGTGHPDDQWLEPKCAVCGRDTLGKHHGPS